MPLVVVNRVRLYGRFAFLAFRPGILSAASAAPNTCENAVLGTPQLTYPSFTSAAYPLVGSPDRCVSAAMGISSPFWPPPLPPAVDPAGSPPLHPARATRGAARTERARRRDI